jgi:hypothetical protein
VGPERHRLHHQRRDAELLGDEGAQAGRIEHARHPHHPFLREARDVRGEEGHLVERVRHDDDDRVRRPGDEAFDHVADDPGVLAEQVHPAHAGLAWEPRGDHDDVRTGGIGVVVGADDVRLEPDDRGRLPHVERQPLRQALHDVDQDDLGQSAFDQPHRGGLSDEPASDDRDPHP